MTSLLARFAALRSAPRPIEILIRRGTRAEADRLAPFHYRPPPATVAGIWVAEHPRAGVVAALTLSYPALNARWRDLAWPGRYRTGDRRADARRLNAEVRTISRVVVDPRYRALGIATRLIRAVLADPPTIRTEAIAAMGAFCPIFDAAGMTPWRLPPTARDRRLRRALQAARAPVWSLLDPARLRILLNNHPALAAALRTWADASRATRALKRAPIAAIARAAAISLAAPRLAYTFEAPLHRPPPAGHAVEDSWTSPPVPRTPTISTNG